MVLPFPLLLPQQRLAFLLLLKRELLRRQLVAGRRVQPPSLAVLPLRQSEVRPQRMHLQGAPAGRPHQCFTISELRP
jgi:hypothetical protein